MDWKRFGFIALIIVVLFGTVVMIGQVKQPPVLIITSMLDSTIPQTFLAEVASIYDTLITIDKDHRQI